MAKETFGVYEYQGISKINPLLNDEENLKYTAFHELIHKFLTEGTSYGDFVTHMQLLSSSIKGYSHSAKVLVREMEKMQEAIAYFLEHIYIKKSTETHEFNVSLNQLKKTNRENFNLMNKLDYLLDLEYKSEDDYVDIIYLVKFMGSVALSFEFPDIKIEQLKNPNKLTSYLKKHKINPNQKFYNINQFVKGEILKGEPIRSIIEGVVKNFSPQNNGWGKNFRQILSEDSQYKTIAHTHPVVFENLNKITIYNQKTGEFKNLIEEDSQLNFVHAGAVSEYPTKTVDLKIFLQIIEEDQGSLYIYGAYVMEVANDTAGYIVVFKSVTQKTTFKVINIDENKLHTIVDNVDPLNGIAATPLAFNPHQGKLLKLQKQLNRNLFIYFDVPYAYSRMILEYMLGDEVVYGAFYIEYPNFNILLIKFNTNHFFLVPILSLSTHSLQEDLDCNRFKLQFINTDEAMKYGQINKEAIDVVDAIVNATLNV
ncbi:hypothetical protein [Bacillus thuringiensis]|uniref:hypothetical protein n=1 Tax=Bacillus thuringiensis TaxID=1428 RepID=UPI000B43DAB6|nr:hypothetical protein [Bacillus thuringiensis]MED3180206.1 hypothetical protein [Bacillus thuringiensis]OTY12641.1 hypothetical protein BK734_10740 [Bacillus thuringiensis serovar kim]OUB21242.1 hypothetical protein BK733_04460 [Bacillus thuringiensis serovar xiaguangiensis]